jgi:hypothetical protein
MGAAPQDRPSSGLQDRVWKIGIEARRSSPGQPENARVFSGLFTESGIIMEIGLDPATTQREA